MDNITLYLLNGPCSSLPGSSDIQLNNEDDELFTAIIKKKKIVKKEKESPGSPVLGFHTFTEEGPSLIPGHGTRIPKATEHSQK